jgi:hypothetical protein
VPTRTYPVVIPIFVRKGEPCRQVTGLSPSQQDIYIEQGLLPVPARITEKICGWTYSRLLEHFEKLEAERPDPVAIANIERAKARGG